MTIAQTKLLPPGETVSDDRYSNLTWQGPEAGSRWGDFCDIWIYRELLVMLTLKELKVRYRQAAVGVFWVILQPLTSVMIFTVIFHLIGRKSLAGETPYPLIAISGILPWQFFSTAVTQATESLVHNQHLISKVYFPRILLPISSLAAVLVDFAVSSSVLIAMMFWFGIVPSLNLLALPLIVALAVWGAFAFGVWLSAANSLYRDITFILPFFIQIGFFVCPVIYETEMLIPEEWRSIYYLNPVVGIIEGFRWCFLPTKVMPLNAIVTSAIVLAFVTVTGALYFRRVNRVLADRI